MRKINSKGISTILFVAGLIIAIIASSGISYALTSTMGLKGEKGDTGETGATGATGATGETGIGFEPTGYISVSGVECTSANYNDQAVYNGWYVRNAGGSSITLYAPVQLPHGVTITNVTSAWFDNSTSLNTGCRFYRVEVSDNLISYSIASCASSGSAGYGSTSAVTISPNCATVDNERFAYYLIITIPANGGYDLRFCYATIEFTYPT